MACAGTPANVRYGRGRAICGGNNTEKEVSRSDDDLRHLHLPERRSEDCRMVHHELEINGFWTGRRREVAALA